jgi:hypothetical protein
LPGYYYLISGTRISYLLVIHLLMTVLNLAGAILSWFLRDPYFAVAFYGLTFCLGGLMSRLEMTRSRSRVGLQFRRRFRIRWDDLLAIAWLVTALMLEVIFLPALPNWVQLISPVFACVVLAAIFLDRIMQIFCVLHLTAVASQSVDCRVWYAQ